MSVKVLDGNSLRETMEARAKHYSSIREQFAQLRKAFQDIVELNEFEGRGAEAIKGFYRGQIEVTEAWQRLIDRQIAFFEGVQGKLEDKNLGSNTRVETGFLEEALLYKERQADEMVSEQRKALQNIFAEIEDLISLDPFSRERFDNEMGEARKKRTDTLDAVGQTDQELLEEYLSSEGEEFYVAALFRALLEATKQGSDISPIHFNADAYLTSEVYQLKSEAEAQTDAYLSFKKEEKEAREIANRPWYEDLWEGTKTFAGEFSGYYDYLRAKDGVDPVTGEKLSAGQRVTAGAMAAAGFIPIVGWAGRAIKGGKGIYSATKAITAADHALDAYRSASTFSALEKTEMGLYGLIAANGLSEYMTGNDMFGNELTDEQRQASLAQGIFAGLPFVPTMAREATSMGKGWIDDVTQRISSSPKLVTETGIVHIDDTVKAESKAVESVSGEKDKALSLLSGQQRPQLKNGPIKTKTSESIQIILEKYGYSVDEFLVLLHPDKLLSEEDFQKVNLIRDEIGLPPKNTPMAKVIPQSDLYNYLYNEEYSGVRGFTAVKEHTEKLITLEEKFEGARLDYNNTAFKITNGIDGISESVGSPDNFFGTIEYKILEPEQLSIPRWEPKPDSYPYTGRGFTGSREVVLPEYYQQARKFVDGDLLIIRDSKTGEPVFKFIFDEEVGWVKDN